MNPTLTSTYRLVPIAATTAAELRAASGISYVADSKPGYPCRQCLRDAEIGDELILVSHDPFVTDSPYRSASPIFLHAEMCRSDLDDSSLPEQLACRQLSVRAFDDDAMMIDAAVIDGSTLDDTLDRFFADAATDRVHIHNASRGCWAVTAVRA